MAIASKYSVLFNAGLNMEELEATRSRPRVSTKNCFFSLRFSEVGSRTLLSSVGNGLNHVFYLA